MFGDNNKIFIVENSRKKTPEEIEEAKSYRQELESTRLVIAETDRINKKQEAKELLTPTEKAFLVMATREQEAVRKLKETREAKLVEINQDSAKPEAKVEANQDSAKPEAKVEANQDSAKPEAKVEANQDSAKLEVEVGLNNENKALFNATPEEKKGLLRRIYEGLYKVSGVNKIIGKLEIAYSDLRINGLTSKEEKLQEEINRIDKETQLSKKSQSSMQFLIADAKEKGAPIASLEQNISLIAKRAEDLSRKKSDIQEKLTERQEQRDVYINKRREVADKLIGYYDEKIKPMEETLASLQTLKSRLDFKSSAIEITHKKQEADLHSIEERLNSVKESYRAEGRPESEIKKTLKDLEAYLDTGRANIQKKREKILDDKEEQEKKIAEAERLVALHKEKRDEFMRTKEGKPRENKKDKVTQDIKTIPIETETISTEQNIERLPVQSYISRWNEYLKNENIAESLKKPIDSKDFLIETGWSDDFVIDFEDFKKILPRYLKLKGIVVEDGILNASIEDFNKNKAESGK